MFFDWLYENALSLALLSIVILLFGFIVWRIIVNKRRAAASPNPACYGCPNAKSCGGGCHAHSTLLPKSECRCEGENKE
ncbi:MAG: hypothetical protein J6Q69_00140 [Clostridia bacterium]|nr:hypothetical protein [Clostridia bacterium]